MRLLSLLIAAACATPSIPQQLPPPQFDVGSWNRGETVTVSIMGLGQANTHAALYMSTTGPGSGPCAPAGSPCLGIRAPRQIGLQRLNQGQAVFTFTVPDSPRVWLQGVVRRQGQWIPSDVVPVTIDEVCNGGVDDDRDGLVDCQDAECFDDPGCTEWVCDDGVDDEGDGLVDCEDEDCWGPDCTTITTQVLAGSFDSHRDADSQVLTGHSGYASTNFWHDNETHRFTQLSGRVARHTLAGQLLTSCTWTASNFSLQFYGAGEGYPLFGFPADGQFPPASGLTLSPSCTIPPEHVLFGATRTWTRGAMLRRSSSTVDVFSRSTTSVMNSGAAITKVGRLLPGPWVALPETP